MNPLYDVNGLVFWSEEEIQLRNFFVQKFALGVKGLLKSMNRAWDLIQIEAPILTPTDKLNTAYSDRSRYKVTDVLSLRPETTPGSFRYLQHILGSQQKVKPPICVWQVGKSFRKEQAQPYKHMRLQEFYQQEFQCLYTLDTLNDYHANILSPLGELLGKTIGLPFRVVESDRLPSYSQVTTDIEIFNGDKWMEICSVSRRTDYPDKVVFATKKEHVEKDVLILEIAIGLDRCVYNYNLRKGKDGGI